MNSKEKASIRKLPPDGLRHHPEVLRLAGDLAKDNFTSGVFDSAVAARMHANRIRDQLDSWGAVKALNRTLNRRRKKV